MLFFNNEADQKLKTPSHLTNITKMLTNMDIFPSLDYTDSSEIVENKKSISCCFKVSFTVAKIALVLNREQRQKLVQYWEVGVFLPDIYSMELFLFCLH